VLKNLHKRITFLPTIDAVKVICEAYQDCQKTAEIEQTNRQEIEANKNIELEKIKATRQVLLTYLDQKFEERSHAFEKLFSQADEAINNNDNNRLNIILSSVVELAKSNPFNDLKDVNSVKCQMSNVKSALKDKDYTWEL